MCFKKMTLLYNLIISFLFSEISECCLSTSLWSCLGMLWVQRETPQNQSLTSSPAISNHQQPLKQVSTHLFYIGMKASHSIDISRVSAFQNYHNFFDVIAERPKPVIETSEPIKMSKWNSVITFRLWRHDDHADSRNRVSSSSRPLHSLTCLFIQRDNSDFEAGKKR